MSENIYKKILEELLPLLDEGVYIVDDQGIGIFYNDAMANIEKVNVEDVIGKEYNKAFPGIKPEESTMFRALSKAEPTTYLQQSYRNMYGKEVSTQNSTVPVVADGKVIAAVEVAQDITNIKDMRDTIMELREKSRPKASKEKQVIPRIREYSFEDIIGRDPEFIEAVDKAKKAAENSATVFIYGETGTGKELFAQSIHRASERKDMPFLAQNCAALPETLLEGILFGTAKGGFTGAVDRVGLFEQASGGTLLLDEISAMPYQLQGKLLRVLQEDYIRRLGGEKDIPVDTRIIATVNEDPAKLIADGRLRKDLFYRLSVVNLNIPSLKSRIVDIPILVKYFLDEYSQKFNKALREVDEKAMAKLLNYDYPGNVRELENIIIQAVSLAGEEEELTENLIQFPVRGDKIIPLIEKRDKNMPLQEYLESLEKEFIREALMDNGGNISKAAESLGLVRQNLQHKMKKYGFK